MNGTINQPAKELMKIQLEYMSFNMSKDNIISELVLLRDRMDDAKKYDGLTAEKAGEVADRIQELIWRIDDHNEVWR
jgi:hypothetical protein